jgi:hypothetical protein
LNTYTYVGGNPIIWIDSKGLKSHCVCKATGGGVPGAKGVKYCTYKCTCNCKGKDVKTFKVKIPTSQRSTNMWDYGDQICIKQRSPNPKTGGDSEFDPFPVETGLIPLPPGWADHGFEPQPSGICEYNPGLCENIDDKCDECK